ncbi:MAG: tryptophan synthase subunit beta [Rickettsiales bacterium]|nr:tryptophan synthase subunit beta [Rickettsiales bacterium]
MNHSKLNYSQPDENGHFGQYGGRYVAETLMPLILQVEQAYKQCKNNPEFIKELDYWQKNYNGRPSPLYYAKNFSEYLGKISNTKPPKIYLKRDELNHTGAHKINHCLGQILLAKYMGKNRIIAETGAGQHGVATATVCALFGMKCVIYMGAKDVERQKPNVFRMKLLGAEVKPVSAGSSSLKDAMNEAMRDWVSNVDDTYYLIGTAAGPHPFPMMVRDFQSIIGKEAREQIQQIEGRLPDRLIACIGGGSNALGLFYNFINDENVKMTAVEAAGKGVDTQETAASIAKGSVGVLHGNKTYYLQDKKGQILESHSISAGLDYPGIGPEHSYLHDIGRVEYQSATDEDALKGFQTLAKTEGIIPALEPSHALGYIIREAKNHSSELIIMNLCGRGDKDIFTIMERL